MDKTTAKNNMITQQLRTNGIVNETILNLYRNIDREAFVPSKYRPFAYSDKQIPLDHEQQMQTPLEEGLIIQSLALQGHEQVLEIGTGTGFLTSLLSRSAQHVISIDCFAEFTLRAQRNCAAYACQNIEFITGDGYQGWVDRAPYDVIVITGGIECITELHKLQLHLGGKLFAIVGDAPVMKGYMCQIDHNKQWTQKLIFETNTPLLTHQKHDHFVF